MVKESFMLEDVKIKFGGNFVGGAQTLSFTRTQENKAVGENANKHAREIVDGPIRINGSIEQLWFDDSMIKATTDDGKKIIDWDNGNNAYFDIIGTTVNKSPRKRVNLTGVKIKNLSGNIALGDETKNTFEFDALRMMMD